MHIAVRVNSYVDGDASDNAVALNIQHSIIIP